MARPSAASPRNGFSSSPVRPSPERRPISDYLSPDRNSEASHHEALEHARLEHERVRLNAIRIGEIHHLKEEQKRIEEAQKREQARLKAEAAVRAEQERLRELQAKKVEPLPPQPDPPKKQAPPPALKTEQTEKETNGATATPAPAPAATPAQAPAPGKTEPTAPVTAQATQPQSTSIFGAPKPAAATPPTSSPLAAQGIASSTTLFGQKSSSTTSRANGAAPSPFAKAASQPTAAPSPVAQPPPTVAASSPAKPDRYVQIHQELKKLRKHMDQVSKVPGSPLKGKLGEMRRSVRKAIGQLTAGKNANAQPINTITTTLKASLSGAVPSDPVDASLFVKDKREPVEGAANNGDQLPSAFVFLLNHLAKAIILQFSTEAGVDPKAAEPIGIVTAHIFSNPEFHWRGKSLIDIIIAKFRIACPVLFGSGGNDKTAAGRLAIGWRKEDGHWVPEQAHMDRMSGLGAGYASISLRDFSKATKQNPYPPTNYWMAVAAIVNTPPQAITSTHYRVLKAMIAGHEARFIQFYGNAAIAALRVALIEFPKKAPPNNHDAQALQVMGQVLQTNMGLVLA